MGWIFSGTHPYAVSARAENREDGTSYRGRLLVDGDELVFEGHDAHVAVPLSGLKLSRNRVLGGPIRLNSRAEPSWTFWTRHTLLFEDPAFDSIDALFAAKKRLALSLYRLRRLARLLLVLFLVVLIAFPVVRRKATDAGLQYVPVKTEVHFGDELMDGIRKKTPPLTDEAANAALNSITQRVLDAIPEKQRVYPFHFYIVKDKTVNAYALPGGHIVIHSGLIAQAKSAEELAGVLAHETGHVLHRHAFTQLGEVVGTLVIGLAVFGDSKNIPDSAFSAATLSFSRDAENEADGTALELMERGRIDPNGLIGFFQRSAREAHQEDKTGALDIWSRMSSTHPDSGDRANALRDGVAKYAKGFTPEKIDVDFEGFQRRVAELTATQEQLK